MKKQMANLCLNMIVKNEAANIRRCLGAVADHVSCWVIGDTGSTDGTQKIIRDFFAAQGIPGELHSFPFESFAQARNEALSRAQASSLSFDYLLLVDADMELVITDPKFRKGLTADIYQVIQDSGVAYWNSRFMRRGAQASYVGVTHEYLDLKNGETRQLTGVTFIDHASGANRSGKFARDAKLLMDALETEQNPGLRARYTFYLANSLRDDGDHAGALQRFMERGRLGHWQEEVFISLLEAAKMKMVLGHPTDDVLAAFDKAAAACPTRAEALHDAARLCRNNSLHEHGYQYAVRGMAIPLPREGLFVSKWIYAYGLLDELSVSAYWSGRYSECIAACERLLTEPSLPETYRPRVLKNKELALDRLREQSSSFTATTMPTAQPVAPVIPPVFHFITGLDKDFGGKGFSFIHAMAIMSALRVNEGFVARVYYEYEPQGPHWNLVKPHVTCFPIVAPREFCGRPIEHFAHRADICRLDILLEHGGIYLDMDTICQKPFAPLLKGSVVMGLEKTSDGATIGLCNATIIAPAGAAFLKLWLDTYNDFTIWNRFAVQLPMRLANQHPDLVRIEPNTSFFWPPWDERGIAALFLEDHAYPDAYSFHLWESKSWDHIKQLNAGRVRALDTTYNRIARRFAADCELPPAYATTASAEVARAREALAQAFTKIYEQDVWSNRSGQGSRPVNTIEYRAFVERFIQANRIRTVTDLGCGDWQFSRLMDWSGVFYKGFDVVASVVEANRERYASEHISFEVLHSVEDLPDGDLLLAKEMLQHLPTGIIMEYIDAIRRKYRFALLTNTIDPLPAANIDINFGGFRPLLLAEAPFHVPGAKVLSYTVQSGESYFRNQVYLVMGTWN